MPNCVPQSADVVVGDDIVADEPRDAGEGVADEGAANVADVHRLGDVGRGESPRRCVSVPSRPARRACRP